MKFQLKLPILPSKINNLFQIFNSRSKLTIQRRGPSEGGRTCGRFRTKSLQTPTVMSERRRRLAADEEEDGSPRPPSESAEVRVKERRLLRRASGEAELSKIERRESAKEGGT